MIWEAVAATGHDYVDWVARKESAGGTPVLHIYVEMKNAETVTTDVFTDEIHEALKGVSPDYEDLERYFGMRPVKTTLLPPGAFWQYMQSRRAAGADLAHIKPPHMNPKDAVIETLLGAAEVAVPAPAEATAEKRVS